MRLQTNLMTETSSAPVYASDNCSVLAGVASRSMYQQYLDQRHGFNAPHIFRGMQSLIASPIEEIVQCPAEESVQDEQCAGAILAPYTRRIRELIDSDATWTEQAILAKVQHEFPKTRPCRLKYMVAREVARGRGEPPPKRPRCRPCRSAPDPGEQRRCAWCGCSLCGRGRGFCTNAACRAARAKLKQQHKQSELMLLEQSGVIYKQVQRQIIHSKEFAVPLNLTAKIAQQQPQAQPQQDTHERKKLCQDCGSTIRGRGSGYCVNAACRQSQSQKSGKKTCNACDALVEGLARRCLACKRNVALLKDTGVVRWHLGEGGVPQVLYTSPAELAHKIHALQQEAAMAKADLRYSAEELKGLLPFPRTYQIRRFWRSQAD